jgi:hypothetical protein
LLKRKKKGFQDTELSFAWTVPEIAITAPYKSKAAKCVLITFTDSSTSYLFYERQVYAAYNLFLYSVRNSELLTVFYAGCAVDKAAGNNIIHIKKLLAIGIQM